MHLHTPFAPSLSGQSPQKTLCSRLRPARTGWCTPIPLSADDAARNTGAYAVAVTAAAPLSTVPRISSAKPSSSSCPPCRLAPCRPSPPGDQIAHIAQPSPSPPRLLPSPVKPDASARPAPVVLRNCDSMWKHIFRLAGTLSGFIARHIEQPGSRQSNPAAAKTRSSPSASACRLTSPEPGTTSARTPSATRRPSATAAAARRSSMRLLVQRADEDVLHADVLHPRCRASAPCNRATSARRRAWRDRRSSRDRARCR